MNERLLTSACVSGLALALACCAPTGSSAQVADGNLPQYAPGTIFDPPSSARLAADVGARAHTHLKIMIRPEKKGAAAALTAGPPYSGYFYETPASLACLYGLTAVQAGCNPDTATTNSTGGSKAIAIVDAYDYPAAATDLATFSTQMGLPAPSSANFAVVYATGTKPPNGTGSGWDVEAALDTQYAHGIAPKAMVYLVEAASNSDFELVHGGHEGRFAGRRRGRRRSLDELGEWRIPQRNVL